MEKFVTIKGTGKRNGGYDTWSGNWDYEDVTGLWREIQQADMTYVDLDMQEAWLECGDDAENIKVFLDEAVEKGFIDGYKLEEPEEEHYELYFD